MWRGGAGGVFALMAEAVAGVDAAGVYDAAAGLEAAVVVRPGRGCAAGFGLDLVGVFCEGYLTIRIPTMFRRVGNLHLGHLLSIACRR